MRHPCRSRVSINLTYPSPEYGFSFRAIQQVLVSNNLVRSYRIGCGDKHCGYPSTATGLPVTEHLCTLTQEGSRFTCHIIEKYHCNLLKLTADTPFYIDFSCDNGGTISVLFATSKTYVMRRVQ